MESPTVSEEIQQINSQFLTSLYNPEAEGGKQSSFRTRNVVILGCAAVVVIVLVTLAVSDYTEPPQSPPAASPTIRSVHARKHEEDNSVTTGLAAKSPDEGALPLLCHLTAPSLIPGRAGATLLPKPCICDYLLLEIRMNEDGSYNAEEFNFLQAYNGESKLLLALPQLAWEDLETTASSETYLDNARNLYNTKGVRGYGLLSFQYKLPTDLSQQVGHISHFYDTLKKELQAGDLQNKFTNFFSVQPRQLSSAKDTFKRLLTELQGRVKFIILETFTRTHEKSCVVEAASSWGPEGLFGDFQPNIRSTLDLAMSIDSAQSTVYVLSFSLLATKFAYVKGTRDDLVGKSCSYATYASFYKYCQRGDGEEERWTTYDDTNFYEFDADPSNVYSFETARSIEDKIRRSSAYLGATRLELGWMAFNLSTSIDNGTCVGEQLRLLKARRVINDIQPKHSSLKRRGDANC